MLYRERCLRIAVSIDEHDGKQRLWVWGVVVLLVEGLPSVIDDHGVGPWDRSQANPYRLCREAYSNSKAK